MALASIEVKGLATLVQATAKIGKEASGEVRRQLVRSAEPVVSDARSRMSALGGTGPKAARTIRLEVTQRGVAFRLGGSFAVPALGREFGAKRNQTRSTTFRNQFGKGITFRGSKAIPYSRPSIFGPWTGNQFTVDPGSVSGRAFYPAIAAGVGRVQRDMQGIVDDWVNILVQAGKLGAGKSG